MSTPDTETAAAAPEPLGPITAPERIITLDILRGIALAGVLIANVWLWFSGIWFLFPDYQEQLARFSLDAVVFHGISALVSGKAITTFSFLFGLGFAVQMQRAEARGAEITPVYRRRLAVLFLFGAVHGVLLWYGDILMSYALLGFALLLFRKRRERTLLVWAAALLVGVPLVMGGIPALISLLGGELPADDPAPLAELRASALAAFQSGEPARVIAENLRMLAFFFFGPKSFWMLFGFGIFLLGLYAGRRRIFENVEAHRAGLRQLMIGGLAVGLVGNLTLTALQIRFPNEVLIAQPRLLLLFSLLSTIAIVPLAFGYIATVTLLVQRAEWRRRLAVFAPVGRMALTNYLSQTVICLLIFYGYGAGLIGRVRPAASLAIALLIFGLQMAWSPWWLARFHFGPAEWLWRSLTYGRLQPMRIREPVALPAQPQLPG